MKMKSVSGIVSYVKDINVTADFYEALGFIVTERTTDKLSIRLNWFWIDFHPEDKEDKPEFQQEARAETKGAGTFLYVSVEDVDQFYENVKSKGLKSSSEPQNYEWGNREFILHDPDGYKLVFFEKLK
jgi:predicted lactoylglutathione lyase